MQNIVISARNLKKTYHSRSGGDVVRALDGLSLDIYEGEILGVLGPNGAGKTTFLNTLSTLLLPDSGEIEILGIKSKEENFSPIRRLINMSSGYPNYPWVLTVEENLLFYGRLYGLSGDALKAKVSDVIELFELKPYAKRRFDELSSGTKQRLSLAKSLLNDPKIVFLDEPTVGLDPDVSIKIRQVIMDVLKKRGVTVLLTSHNMSEVEEMCDRVAFIKQGKIIKLATVAELKTKHQTDDLEKVFIQLAAGQQNETQKFSNELAKTKVVQSIPKGTWFNRVLAFTFRNALFSLRNLFVMTDVFFWPLMSLLPIGLMAKFVHMDANMQAFIITGTIAVSVMQITQLDVGYTVLYELWSKSLKHTVLTPIGVSEGVIGTWLIGMTRALAVFIFLVASAAIFFGFKLPDPIHTLGFLIGLFASGLLFGMLVNVLILSFGSKVEITAWMFVHLFMIFCGIYYPVDVLPPFFQSMAYLIPITHFLEFFREGYGFTPHTPQPWLAGAGLIVLYWFVSLQMLKSAYSRARRKGVIIRLSE
jgi:ABC-2 type transport system ATP-binding protein